MNMLSFNLFKRLAVVSLLLLLAACSQSNDGNNNATNQGSYDAPPKANADIAPLFEEGVDYEILPASRQFTLNAQPEVVEFFYYGCPHCNKLSPYLEAWTKNEKPANVNLVPVPALFSKQWEWSARMYYSIEVLDKYDEMHHEVYRRYFAEPSQLSGPDDWQRLFADYGVASSDFFATFYTGDYVKQGIERSRNLTTLAEIRGTPSIFVLGKYRTDLIFTRGDAERLMDVIDYLLAKG